MNNKSKDIPTKANMPNENNETKMHINNLHENIASQYISFKLKPISTQQSDH
jgi:hypothetical protein